MVHEASRLDALGLSFATHILRRYVRVCLEYDANNGQYPTWMHPLVVHVASCCVGHGGASLHVLAANQVVRDSTVQVFVSYGEPHCVHIQSFVYHLCNVSDVVTACGRELQRARPYSHVWQPCL